MSVKLQTVNRVLKQIETLVGARDDKFLHPHTMGSVACYFEFLSSPHQQCIQSVSSFDHQGKDPLGKRYHKRQTGHWILHRNSPLIQDQETPSWLRKPTRCTPLQPFHTERAISQLCCALCSRTGCCLYFSSFLFPLIIYILIYLFFSFPSNLINIRWRVWTVPPVFIATITGNSCLTSAISTNNHFKVYN